MNIYGHRVCLRSVFLCCSETAHSIFIMYIHIYLNATNHYKIPGGAVQSDQESILLRASNVRYNPKCEILLVYDILDIFTVDEFVVYRIH